MSRSETYPAELNVNNCLYLTSNTIFLYLFSISLVFLLLTLSVYLILPALRTLGGKIIICEIISITSSFFFLLLIIIYKDEFSFNQCLLMGYITHYALLCHFFWLNVMSFDIWLTFRSNAEINWMRRDKNKLAQKEARRFKYYILYAFGAPLLIILFTFMAQKLLSRENLINPRVGHIKCFIEQTAAKNLFYFYPLTLLAISNIIFFTATAQKIFSETKNIKRLFRRNNSKLSNLLELEIHRYLIYVKLFVVMGVSWLAEPLSGLFGGWRCWWMILDLVNASLGLPVFLIFVCKRRTLYLLCQQFCPERQLFLHNQSLTTSSTSSSSRTTNKNRLLTESLMIGASSTAFLLSPIYENTRV